jgi:hypothetical protein
VDPGRGKLLAQRRRLGLAKGGVPGHEATGTVARGVERLAVGDACEHVRGGAHRSRDEHGLTHLSDRFGQVGMAGRKCPRGALSMHAQAAWCPVDGVRLELGEIVRDVVDQAQATEPGAGEGGPGGVAEQLPVGPPVVGGGRHRGQVALALRRLHRRTGQLLVGDTDAVPAHRRLHGAYVVGADLVAQPPRSTVDHHAEQVGPQAQRLGDRGVVDLLDRLHLQEMVARSEAAELPAPPLAGPVPDRPRIGVGDCAPVLAERQIVRLAEAMRDGVRRALTQNAVEFGRAGRRQHAAAPHPARDGLVEAGHEAVHARRGLGPGDGRGEQPHAARDVEADPAGRDHAALGRVRGGHAADREAVTPVQVRHRVGRLDDAGQGGDVGHLLQRLVRGPLGQQGVGGEDNAGHAHLAGGLDA